MAEISLKSVRYGWNSLKKSSRWLKFLKKKVVAVAEISLKGWSLWLKFVKNVIAMAETLFLQKVVAMARTPRKVVAEPNTNRTEHVHDSSP